MTTTRLSILLILLVALLQRQVQGFLPVPVPNMVAQSSSSSSRICLSMTCPFASMAGFSFFKERKKQNQQVLLDRLGGEAALEAAVEVFYKRVIADPELERFFDTTDMEALKQHQYKFMEIAFTIIPKDMDVGKYINGAHKRLLKEEGLNETHFDLVAGHLVATLKGLGVADKEVDEVVATVGPLRAVFEGQRP